MHRVGNIKGSGMSHRGMEISEKEEVWRIIQWCVGMGKKEAVIEGSRLGGIGVLRECSCKWFRTCGSLLTMKGKSLKIHLLRGSGEARKFRENEGAQSGSGREMPLKDSKLYGDEGHDWKTLKSFE